MLFVRVLPTRMLGAIRNVYASRGIEGIARLGAERLLFRSALDWSLARSAYWSLAPRYYRWQYPTDFEDGPATPDPFKIERIDPRRVERLTRRCYPPWWNRRSLFGAVRDGDWDRRPHDEAPTYGGPPSELFVAPTLEETPLYRALERHFRDGVAWTETAFVRDAIALLEAGRDPVWHDCRSRSDVLDRCERLEELYRRMDREGCRSHRERTAVRDRADFLTCLEREIIVDVGRDGSLLLVSGKHRLSLARLLGLSSVPVVFLVRHADWMATRRAVANGEAAPGEDLGDHPDLRDLKPGAAERSIVTRREGVA